MSDFLLADGFGNLSDGLHTAGATREVLGDQWSGFTQNFNVEDMGDGRKWLKNKGSPDKIHLQSGIWSGQATLRLAFRLYRGDNANSILFGFHDGASVLGCLSCDVGGALTYRINTDYDIDYGVASSTSTIPLLTETHVEVVITFHNSTGAVSFYINGILSNTVSGIDTIAAGTSCTSIVVAPARYAAIGLNDGWKIGDVLVHTASSPIGDVGIYYRPVDAAGTDSDFTPSAGSNEDNVDEVGPDEDATYNESDGTSGHRDALQCEAITGVNVLSVQALVRARKTGAGAASLKVGAYSNGSEDQSAAKGLSTAYLTLVHFADDNPDTGNPWTPAEVSAAEVSYEVV